MNDHKVEDSLDTIIKERKKNRRWHVLTSVFSIFIVFGVAYSLMMPATTQGAETFCGMQEHEEHTEDCYQEESVWICDKEEHIHTEGCYEEQPVLICNKEEDETHTHDESCYEMQKVLICGQEETKHEHEASCTHVEKTLKCTLPIHKHSLSCYSDPNADLESANIWETTMAGVSLTGDGANDVVEIAKTQLGYHESTKNYQVLSDGTTKQGYSRYGAWYGDAYGDWCAMFASFCIRYAGIQDFPVDSNCQHWIDSLTNKDCYRNKEIYEPKMGDLVFFDKNGDGISDHVGIVKEYKDSILYTIEGNMDDKVQSLSWFMEDATIMGFGLMPSLEEVDDFKANEGPVIGTVTPYKLDNQPRKVMRSKRIQTENASPLFVEDYVVPENKDGKKTQLLYKRPKEEEWKVFTRGSKLPGDASLRIEIVYANVLIQDLIDANRQLTYTVPPYMKDVMAQGNITAEQEVVGTIDVQGNTAILTFSKEFIDKQVENGNTLLAGTFYVESKMDLNQVGSGKPGHLVIGGVIIDIEFDSDLIAKYGTVDLEKSVATKVKDDVLEYTLKVTAGEYGCQDIKVYDAFDDTKYIEEYVGVTGEKVSLKEHPKIKETGASKGKEGFVYLGKKVVQGDTAILSPVGKDLKKPGHLVWELGNLDAHEVRTLTYSVRLKKEYVGVQAKDVLTNTAQVFSKEYPRDESGATFTPYAGLDEKKMASKPKKNEDGTYTISYSIRVKAYDKNTHTLENVKIRDSLRHAQNGTDSKYLNYIKFKKDSFQLKDKDNKEVVSKNPHGKENPEFLDDGDGFAYYIGDLAPGQERTLTYDLIVEPGFFIEAGNAEGKIRNRALLYMDDTRGDANKNHVQAYNTTTSMDKKQWSRKMVGESIQEDRDIALSGKVFDDTTTGIRPIEKPEASFTVPKGSFGYTVIVNEAGDWNIGSASLTDTLQNQYMQFTGYVKVEVYDIQQKPSGTDAEVNQAFEAMPAKQTVWVKVDGQNRFQFKPVDLGLSKEENYALRLTYYAKPVHIEDISQVVVTNDFTLSGKVGLGNFWYDIAGIGVQGSVVVGNATSFKAEKKALSFDHTQTEGNYTTGTMYWAIQIEGLDIPVGLELKDTPVNGNENNHKDTIVFEDSVVGIYKGKLAKDITDYDSYEQAIINLEKINPSKYSVKLDQGSIQIKMKERIDLKIKEKAYVIVRSKPKVIPDKKRDVYYFENGVSHRFQDGSWIEDNTARQYIYGSENILKELHEVFTWDGSKKTTLTNGVGGNLATHAIQGKPGTYAAWNIKVNYMGNLQGRYTITDHLPEGMEVVYARIKWLGSSYPDREDPNHSYVPKKTDLVGWQEHSFTSDTDECGQRTTYYYTKDHEVCWDVTDLIANEKRDEASIDFQILCRITDPDVLLGGTPKDFNNIVTLSNMDGKEIGKDFDGIHLEKTSLHKKGMYDPEAHEGRYPFEVAVNPLGEDLIPSADTIRLIDEMSPSLKLDVSSVQVKNTLTAKPLDTDQFTVSTQGQILRITIPDDQPLTITYEALVQAAPGEPVFISNKAHWEGYTSPSGGSVVEENFEYVAGGTVSTSETPYVRIVKLDQNDAHKTLKGAKFKITEMEFNGKTFEEAFGGQQWVDQTTDVKGQVEVGKQDPLMKWNTVYRIEETQAPAGYVLDSKPIYFAVAKKEDGKYPEILNQYKEAGAQISYQGAEFVYQAMNHKGSVTVTKKFDHAGNMANIHGIYRFGLYRVKDAQEELVQIKSLPISSGSTNTSVTFNNLELDQTYRIYELDDEKKPIQDGSIAKIHGQLFKVDSKNNTIHFDEKNYSDVHLEITNRVHMVELPETGGQGAFPIYTAGAVLCAFALIQLKKGRK